MQRMNSLNLLHVLYLLCFKPAILADNNTAYGTIHIRIVTTALILFIQ